MAKKLFIYEFTHRAYVALDEDQPPADMLKTARSFQLEIEADNAGLAVHNETLRSVPVRTNPLNWPLHALVYTDYPVYTDDTESKDSELEINDFL